MAIEFYVETGHELSINEKVFVQLSAAQKELRAKVGREVDPYGTTVLSPEHASVWSQALHHLLPTLSANKAAFAACTSLVALLNKAAKAKLSVRIEGE